MNTTTPQDRELREPRFARQIKLALDERVDAMPSNISRRLANARKDALARLTPQINIVPALEPAYAGSMGGSANSKNGSGHWFARFGLTLPAVVLIVAIGTMYWWQQNRVINETADIDAAVLTDDIPVQIYSDKAFGQYLQNRGEE